MDLNKGYMNTIYIKRLAPNAQLPTRAHPNDAGLDLYALEDVHIPVGEVVAVRTGIAVDILPEYVGRILDRSSMAVKGFRVGAGVIDAHYAGEVKVVLHNIKARNVPMPTSYYADYVPGYTIRKGDKIAQLVVQLISIPEVIETTHDWSRDRGHKGFGSSGQ